MGGGGGGADKMAVKRVGRTLSERVDHALHKSSLDRQLV